MKILFLDIDGTLVSGRALALPENAPVLQKLAQADTGAELALASALDPCAVALIGRVCRLSGAQIIVHSGRRWTVGNDATVEHLVSHGLPLELFHPQRCCRLLHPGHKDEEIRAFIADHRPESVLVIDDESLGRSYPQILIDAREGFTMANYRGRGGVFRCRGSGFRRPPAHEARLPACHRTVQRPLRGARMAKRAAAKGGHCG
jgi:HAD domain in Swiss Army Knife RNA repair proteins